jgi:hypothetical protein
MAGCSADRFVITRGVPNTFIFTIKADGTTLPMEIDAGDTFQATLSTLESNSSVLSKPLTVVDALSGKVSLVLTASEANTLQAERGSKVDRYYIKPVYKLTIECSTLNNGDFIAKIPEIYVD